jgi:hypothetical protein
VQRISPTSSRNPNTPSSFQTAKPSWVAIGGLTLFTFLGVLLGAGSILRFIFPLASLGVGLFLYFQYSIVYIGFTWWIWFLTPLVSRLLDYRSGWDPSRLILVAPYLVTMITTITLVKHLPKNYNRDGFPFLLAIVGIAYGSCIGLINNQFFAVARSFLDWFSPIAFSFHLWVNWREYPRYREVIQSTFLWGVLVMGAYGVIQYLFAPEWDRFWLNESGMLTSSGTPEPLGIRVWSTMHSPGPFAVVMLAGLLLLFTHKKPLRIPAAILGALAFLLSLVRSSWVGWMLAMLMFIPSLKTKLQLRIISTALILSLCIFPLATIEPFASKIVARVQTLTDIQNDGSFRSRKSRLDRDFQFAISKFQGRGLGHVWSFDQDGFKATVIDSGILDLFYTLGWVGAIPYLCGLILIIANVLQAYKISSDPFINAMRSLGLSYCSLVIIGSVFLSVSGLLLWSCLIMTLAGARYDKYQNKSNI